MKKLFFIISATFLPFSSNAWEACGIDADGNTANCEYQIIDGTLTIRGVGNNGNIGSWEKFDSPWKLRSQEIKNLVIEDSIKHFGVSAFSGMKFNTPIVIPNGVESINDVAFRGVTAPEIVIPNTVTTLGYASLDWSHIDKINIPDSVTTIDIAFRGGNFKDIIIPDSVTSISDMALSYASVETLTIGENTKFSAIFKPEVEDEPLTNTANIKIYCIGDTSKCDKNLADAGYPELKSSKATLREINGKQYVFDASGKIAASFGSRTEKRIYTIDEANAVAGDKNRVSIKYR